MRWVLVVSVLLVSLFTFAFASSAQVTLYVTPTNQDGEILTLGSPLTPGDQLTFDIAARNDGTEVAGLGVSALGYQAAGLEFSSGRGVPQLFATICLDEIGCFGGLDGSTSVRDSLSESPILAISKVQIFNHISLTPATATGEDDWGWNGVPGDPQARVIFNVTSGGYFQQGDTIAIGAFEEYGDALVLSPSGNLGTVETIWVVPEPGTAILMGLGLAGLAARRRSD